MYSKRLTTNQRSLLLSKSVILFAITIIGSPNFLNALSKSFAPSDWGTFIDSGSTINNGVFEFPSSAQSWAGFWNSKDSLFPFTFTSGGQLTFTASVPSGGNADVNFKFERLSFNANGNGAEDTLPSYRTESITISGANASQYTIEIPSQGNSTFSSFLFYIEGRDVPVQLGTVVVEDSVSTNNEYPEYYSPSNVTSYNGNFIFGENIDTGNSILWKQEVNPLIHNNEIQNYRGGYVGLDDNDNLVLKIERTGSNTYYSSRINTTINDGIKVGSGEKLTVEFEAQLPMAKDSNGNYVPNVPLWPALWLMGNDQLNNDWVGWPYCAEIDVMEWSPTKAPNYQTQANVAYHWNGQDSGNYTHWYDSEYYIDSEIHTKFHKWRVDIYRYDDGINTNKIEIFMNDAYISGSLFEESTSSYNQEYWYPTTSINPQIFGSGDKEYFLIMNIALGGDYPGTSNVPSNFQYAEMVVKSVNYEITSLTTYTLDLNYDLAKIAVTKTPDSAYYSSGESVLVEAIANPGFVLGNSDWITNTIIMDANKSFSISAYPDFSDSDGDGLNNYNEAVIYNSNLNNPDSDNDNSSDYFESIAGTSLTNASDYFYMQGSMNSLGLYNIEYNTKSTREYSLSVSDDLTNWYNWKTESGDGSTYSNIFDPSLESINGLNTNSQKFFFKVNIEEEQDSSGPGEPGEPGGPSGPAGPGGPGGA